MFRFHKPVDVITLFHKPSTAASTRALALLKQASAQAATTATEDQASDHSAQNDAQRSSFELDVADQPPTPDQLRSILEYVGDPAHAKDIVAGASDAHDALRRYEEDRALFRTPLIVDWSNGKVVTGDNESQILKLLKSKQQP